MTLPYQSGLVTQGLMTDPGEISAVPEPSAVLVIAAGLGLIALVRARARLDVSGPQAARFFRQVNAGCAGD